MLVKMGHEFSNGAVQVILLGGRVTRRPKPNVFVWVDSEFVTETISGPTIKELNTDERMTWVPGYFMQAQPKADLTSFRGEVDKNYAGLTYCYNSPLLAERVNDITIALREGSKDAREQGVDLKTSVVGTGQAGPIALLAAAASGEKFERVIVDLNGFSFSKVRETNGEMMLPGALRYGDIGGLAAMVSCKEMTLFGTKGIPAQALEPLKRIAKHGNMKLTLHNESLDKTKLPVLLK